MQPLSTLNDDMQCGILSNAQGDLMIIHSAELPASIDYVQYDEVTREFFMVDEEGGVKPMGLTLSDKSKNNIKLGTQIALLHLENEEIKAVRSVPILINTV